MSLPQMDPRELAKFEAPLTMLAQQSGGDLRKLLYVFFRFLHQRTDFYVIHTPQDIEQGMATMGFKEGDAEKLLLAAFRQFPLRRMPQQRQAKAAMQQQTAAAKKQEETPATSSSSSKQQEESSSIRYTEEGLQIPVGNGGTTKRYKWTQTIEECSVMIPVGDNVRGKDLDVVFRADSLEVRVKSSETVLLQGDLYERIVPAESTWTMESGVLILVLDKHKKTFWKTIVKGDEEIDASMVDSRRHISEYDESTQAQIRKLMHEQQQSGIKLPPEAQMLNAEMLQKNADKLPPGVEIIDQEKLDKHAVEKK